MLQTRPCWMSQNIYVWHAHQASYFITHNLNLPHCRSNTKFRCLLPCDTHHFRRMGPENAPCPSTHQWTVATNSPNFSQPGFVISTSCWTGIILFFYSIWVSILSISHFWDRVWVWQYICFQNRLGVYIMQEPVYLGKIALTSIWLRMVCPINNSGVQRFFHIVIPVRYQ